MSILLLRSTKKLSYHHLAELFNLDPTTVMHALKVVTGRQNRRSKLAGYYRLLAADAKQLLADHLGY